MIGEETDEIITEMFESLSSRYQKAYKKQWKVAVLIWSSWWIVLQMS